MRSARITALMGAFLVAFFAVSAAEPPGKESPVAATVLGTSITAADIGLQREADNTLILPAQAIGTAPARDPLNELRTRVLREISRDYVEKHNLQATAQEIQEFQDYQERFMAQDRLRRQQRLADLDSKLRDATLSAPAREQAEKNRATLLSLAARDVRQDEPNRDVRPRVCRGSPGCGWRGGSSTRPYTPPTAARWPSRRSGPNPSRQPGACWRSMRSRASS